MECNYQIVENKDLKKSGRSEWISLLRQTHICSGAWTMFYMAGLCAGAPTVFIPQLRKAGADIIDDELASWLYSVSNITSIPWVIILPLFTRYTGRKPAYILACLTALAVFIILYISTTPNHILAAGAIQGYVNASNVIIMTMVLNEYTSTKYRDILMNVTTPSFFWGIWSSNAIGTYFNWKYIPILGIICSVYTFTVAFCPESPIWLASKSKYKKTEDAFKWLNGSGEESVMQLNELIKLQMDYQDKIKNKKCNLNMMATITKKEFYKPLILCLLLGAQYNFSGKFVCSSYAIEVISKMTESLEAAHSGMLILDGVTILGMYSGSFLFKIFKRRTLYFFSTFAGVSFLLMISIYLFLVRLSILTENNVITICLLCAYSMSISSGSMIMCIAMFSEIIPLRYQTVTYIISCLSLMLTTSTLLKLAPMSINYLGIDGTFCFFGVTCGVITIILFSYLPDLDGKTRFEIEKCFKDNEEEHFKLATID